MQPRRTLLTVVSLMAALLIMGTTGYRVLEGWSWSDSIYMTVITLATVGFAEVHEMDAAGKMFTIVLIVGGVSVVGYSVTLMTGFIVEGRINEALRGRRMGKMIEKLSDHYIVCGFGRIGSVVVSELVESGKSLVVIDTEQHPEGISVAGTRVPLIVGDATDEGILQQAGIERAKGLVTALSGDPENIMVALVASGLNMDLTIVARATSEGAVSKLYRAGATKVVAPYELGALRMASLLLRPSVMDFLDVMMCTGDVEIRLEQITLSDDSCLSGQTIRDAHIGGRTGAIILAVRTLDGKLVNNPSGNHLMQGWEQLIVMGRHEQIEALKELAKC